MTCSGDTAVGCVLVFASFTATFAPFLDVGYAVTISAPCWTSNLYEWWHGKGRPWRRTYDLWNWARGMRLWFTTRGRTRIGNQYMIYKPLHPWDRNVVPRSYWMKPLADMPCQCDSLFGIRSSITWSRINWRECNNTGCTLIGHPIFRICDCLFWLPCPVFIFWK